MVHSPLAPSRAAALSRFRKGHSEKDGRCTNRGRTEPVTARPFRSDGWPGLPTVSTLHSTRPKTVAHRGKGAATDRPVKPRVVSWCGRSQQTRFGDVRSEVTCGVWRQPNVRFYKV